MAACLSKEAVSKADTSLLIDAAGDSRLEASDDGGGGGGFRICRPGGRSFVAARRTSRPPFRGRSFGSCSSSRIRAGFISSLEIQRDLVPKVSPPVPLLCHDFSKSIEVHPPSFNGAEERRALHRIGRDEIPAPVVMVIETTRLGAG